MSNVRPLKHESMNRTQFIAELGSLELPASEFVVVGGGVLVVHGIRDTEDIDIVVTPRLFAELATRGWQPKATPDGKPGLRLGRAEAYLDVNCSAFQRSTQWLLDHAQVVDGVPLIDLRTLALFKAGYGREKDVRDLALIQRSLNLTTGSIGGH